MIHKYCDGVDQKALKLRTEFAEKYGFILDEINQILIKAKGSDKVTIYFVVRDYAGNEYSSENDPIELIIEKEPNLLSQIILIGAACCFIMAVINRLFIRRKRARFIEIS